MSKFDKGKIGMGWMLFGIQTVKKKSRWGLPVKQTSEDRTSFKCHESSVVRKRMDVVTGAVGKPSWEWVPASNGEFILLIALVLIAI